MKRLFCFITTFLTFFTSIRAQQSSSIDWECDGDFMLSEINDSNPIVYSSSDPENNNDYKAFRVLTDVGKSITYFGAGLAYAGAAYLAMLSHDHRIDSVYGLAAIVGIAGFAYGGIATLGGITLWLPGEGMLRKNGCLPAEYSQEDKKGFGVLLDFANGLKDSVSAQIALGYNFNKHLFMGVGASYNFYFKRNENTRNILPVYFRTRLTVWSHAVAPYIDVDLGVDALDGSFFYSTSMGVRYRLSSHQNALYVGSFVDACKNMSSAGLKLGYSF